MTADNQSVSRSSRVRAWLQLLRAPNLFTVPGDPLVGFLLAWDGTRPLWLFAPAVFASLFFYSAGLLSNDLADLAEDRTERPQRPLPSGMAKARTVWIVAIALASIAMLLCALGGSRALMTGCGVAVAIGIYNFHAKKLPLFGPCSMGLCRGLSVLLGASFAGRFTPSALLAAGVIAFYIAAVTNLARHETRIAMSSSARWWPLVASSAGFLASYVALDPFVRAVIAGHGNSHGSPQFLTWTTFMVRTAFFAFFFPVLIVCGIVAAKVRAGAPIPPLIGLLIRALIFMQAAFCVTMSPFFPTAWIGFAVLLLWPLSHAASRRFYAS